MFDEQPDGDPHGECAAEIHRLQAENEKLRAACADMLSVRDQFAKAALQGLCANPGGPIQANGMSGWGFTNCEKNDVAKLAYIMADAMLVERNAGNLKEPQ